MQSNTGNLYRIAIESREVTRIDLGGETLMGGDGILLDGQTLYVCRNQQEQIFPLEMSPDLTSAAPGEPFTDASFMYPTTIAIADDRLLAVNSQFDAREGGEEPELPFNVTSVPILE